jgi:hypothetical protein
MEANLQAGVAVYNAGYYHAAHDAWEDHWLDLESGTDDEQFLHGLIQFTAAIHHAHDRNWSGTVGLADSARDYLDGLPPDYRDVDVKSVRRALEALAADPARVEREPVPALTYADDALALKDLGFEATAVAADVLADEFGYDEATVEQAVAYAHSDLADGNETSQFVTFLFDFVRDDEHRQIVFQRLSEHVDRRRHRERDVDGLFE